MIEVRFIEIQSAINNNQDKCTPISSVCGKADVERYECGVIYSISVLEHFINFVSSGHSHQKYGRWGRLTRKIFIINSERYQA